MILSVTYDHCRLLELAFIFVFTSRTCSMVDAFLTLPNCVHCNETLAPSFWILSVTCDHALWLLRLALIFVFSYLPLLRTRAIVNPIIMPLPNCTLSALRVTIDNLRQLWSTYFGLCLCSCLLSITFVFVKLHTLQQTFGLFVNLQWCDYTQI